MFTPNNNQDKPAPTPLSLLIEVQKLAKEIVFLLKELEPRFFKNANEDKLHELYETPSTLLECHDLFIRLNNSIKETQAIFSRIGDHKPIEKDVRIEEMAQKYQLCIANYLASLVADQHIQFNMPPAKSTNNVPSPFKPGMEQLVELPIVQEKHAKLLQQIAQTSAAELEKSPSDSKEEREGKKLK